MSVAAMPLLQIPLSANLFVASIITVSEFIAINVLKTRREEKKLP